MRGGDGVVFVVCESANKVSGPCVARDGYKGFDMMGREEEDSLCSADNMTPVHTDFISGFDIDDFAGRGDTRVTSDIPIVHIQDGVVR